MDRCDAFRSSQLNEMARCQLIAVLVRFDLSKDVELLLLRLGTGCCAVRLEVVSGWVVSVSTASSSPPGRASGAIGWGGG